MDVNQVDYMVIDFPGELPAETVVPPIQALVEDGAVEILDLAFIRRDAGGLIEAVELDALGDAQGAAFADLTGEIHGLLSDEDLQLVGEELPHGSTAAVLVWENTATRALKRAVLASGGTVVAHERVPAGLVERDLTAIGMKASSI
ncbi:hypothetical protein KDL01_27340 [Actinospica durhamensis]|uniref:DUF1269 domain-containing protein n=1 Tax=Actinospica durhamensis TaxID=1508375 RepID=A0A941EU16_9ACTN|nr:DUF6325 family protein [Actinospica durhamensis]MBR7837021.1 hypothetical protein [Actinospica durhamensis]